MPHERRAPLDPMTPDLFDAIPATWRERRAQLMAREQWAPATGPVCCFGVYRATWAPALRQAARELDLPILVREEQYPDIPGKVIIYRTAPIPQSLEPFWRRVNALRRAAQSGTSQP